MATDLRNIGMNQPLPSGPLPDDGSTAAANVDGAQVVQSPLPLRQSASASSVGSAPIDSIATTKANSSGIQSIPAYTSMAPELPDPVGPKASIKETASIVANTTMFNTTPSSPISTAEMFTILQSSASKSYELATSINTIAGQNVIAAKQKEVTDTVKQIEGERKAAATTFATGILSSAAGITVGYAGARMAKSPTGTNEPKASIVPLNSSSPEPSTLKPVTPTVGSHTKPNTLTQAADASAPNGPNTGATTQTTSPSAQAVAKENADKVLAEKQAKREAAGASLAQMGQSVAGAVSGGGELYNKVAGGNYEADQAKIAVKMDQVQSQIAEVSKDSSKSAQDQALEAVKTAQQAVQSYSQRWTEVTNNTANR